MMIESRYEEFRRQGIGELPSAILCLAQVIQLKKFTIEDADVFSHGLFMALKELQKQGIVIPLSIDHTTEGSPGIDIKGDIFLQGGEFCNPFYVERIDQGAQ